MNHSLEHVVPLLLALFYCQIAFSQSFQINDDFESDREHYIWVADGALMDLNFANPHQGTANNSSHVLRYEDDGNGLFTNIRLDIPFHFNIAEDAIFELKIYVESSSISGNSPNQISLKLQDGGLREPWTSQTEIIKPLQLDTWQTIQFDFKNDSLLKYDNNAPDPANREDYNRVLIQINGENNTNAVTAYIDDFSYSGTIGWDTFPADQDNTTLLWADEFDGSGMIDTSKWFHQTIIPNGVSWFNGELQHYTDRIENSYLDNGNLVIVAQKESFTDQGRTKNYTSARLNSKFAFQYGRVDARVKFPFGFGTWPAVWMLGQNITENGGYFADEFGSVGWPACGEIDIVEHWGDNQNFIQAALHTPSSSGSTINKGGVMANSVSDLFHIYSMKWTPTEIEFYIDGKLYYTYDPSIKTAATWPFDAPQYLLLNVAIASNIDAAYDSSAMEIDYLRVYQGNNPIGINELESKQELKLYPNPAQTQVQLSGLKTYSKVQLYSLTGELVKQFNVLSTASINISDIPSGYYFISVTSDGIIHRKPLIKP